MCCYHGDVRPLNKGALCSNPRGSSLPWELGLSHLFIKVTPGAFEMRQGRPGHDMEKKVIGRDPTYYLEGKRSVKIDEV